MFDPETKGVTLLFLQSVCQLAWFQPSARKVLKVEKGKKQGGRKGRRAGKIRDRGQRG